MKFNKVILTSIISVLFLCSCASKDKISYTVTGQEFKDALTFKDVQYLQLFCTIPSTSNVQICECSPTVFHGIVDESPSYMEMFVTPKQGTTDTWIQYKRTSKTAIFPQPTETKSADAFTTPQKINVLATMLKPNSLDNYADYTYNESNHTYTANKQTSSGLNVDAILSFVDKKINSLKINTGRNVMENTFTYNAVTPTLPN